MLREVRDRFEPHVAAGVVIECLHGVRHHTAPYTRVIYVRPGDEAVAERLHLRHRPLETGEPWQREWDIEIGRLLGYPRAAIEAFMARRDGPSGQTGAKAWKAPAT